MIFLSLAKINIIALLNCCLILYPKYFQFIARNFCHDYWLISHIIIILYICLITQNLSLFSIHVRLGVNSFILLRTYINYCWNICFRHNTVNYVIYIQFKIQECLMIWRIFPEVFWKPIGGKRFKNLRTICLLMVLECFWKRFYVSRICQLTINKIKKIFLFILKSERSYHPRA